MAEVKKNGLSLIRQSRVLRDELKVAQLVKKLPAYLILRLHKSPSLDTTLNRSGTVHILIYPTLYPEKEVMRLLRPCCVFVLLTFLPKWQIFGNLTLDTMPFGGTPSDGHLNFLQSVISKWLTRKLLRLERHQS